MLGGVSDGASLALALLFGFAALAKGSRPQRWASALRELGFPAAVRLAATPVVPIGEATIATLLLLGHARAGATLAAVALVVFTLVILRARASFGDRLPCACFGASPRRDYRAILARNIAMLALAAIVLLAGDEARALDALRLPRSGEYLPATLAVSGLAIAVWALVQARSSLGTASYEDMHR